MELPTERKPPKSINPRTMIIYAAPKVGKTTICAGLLNSLILELEPGGGDFVEGTILEIEKPKDLTEAIKKIKEKNSKGELYKYIIIDTLTKLDEWSEIIGTYNYMNKSQGKKWNRDESGNIIYHTDSRFETVHELGQGFGYQHSREQMIKWFEELITLAPHTIFLTHIKDKSIETKAGNVVDVIDLNLTGKVKSILTSRVDAVALLTKKQNKCYLNFDNEHKSISGGRCKHLNGEILISEKMEDGEIKTFWENIYK